MACFRDTQTLSGCSCSITPSTASPSRYVPLTALSSSHPPLPPALASLAFLQAILKYTDNIVRVFAHAAAMMLTMALEIFLFGASPTPQLLISATVVACAVYLYNRAPPPPSSVNALPPSPPNRLVGLMGRGSHVADDGRSGGEREGLLSGERGDERGAGGLPLMPMLTRGADGYSIRTRPLGSDD